MVKLLLILFVSVGCLAQDAGAMRRSKLRQASAGSSYSANTASFAGDGQCWLELDSTDSVSDGKVGTISVWLNFSGDNNAASVIFTTNGRLIFTRSGGDNSLRARFDDSGGITRVEVRQNTSTVGSLTASSGWSWVSVSWNNDTAGACYMYIANAATSWVATDCTTRTDNTGGGETLDYTDFDFVVGDNNGGGSQPFTGCMSELYVDLTNYRDLTSSSVRDNFYNSSTHKPAGDLSAYGSPAFYLKGSGTGFTANSGSAGNLTKKGTTALSTCTAP